MIKVIVQPSEISQVDQVAVRELARNRCNRLMQISFEANEDNQGRYFKYNIHLLKMEPNGIPDPTNKSTGVVTRSEYQRSYRYPRTVETMTTFNIGAFALRAYFDMKASGALETLR